MKTFIKKILPLKMVDFVKNLLSVYRQKDYTNKRTTNAVDYMDGIINLYKGVVIRNVRRSKERRSS